jgi:hypothetical protein
MVAFLQTGPSRAAAFVCVGLAAVWAVSAATTLGVATVDEEAEPGGTWFCHTQGFTVSSGTLHVFWDMEFTATPADGSGRHLTNFGAGARNRNLPRDATWGFSWYGPPQVTGRPFYYHGWSIPLCGAPSAWPG